MPGYQGCILLRLKSLFTIKVDLLEVLQLSGIDKEKDELTLANH